MAEQTGSIETWRVKAFRENVRYAVGQKESRLSPYCDQDGDMIGDLTFFDNIGRALPQKKTQDKKDSPDMGLDHGRRASSYESYEWGTLLPKKAKLETLHDPANHYTVAATHGFNVRKDDEIIRAAFATAREGEKGDILAPFPSRQIIPHNNEGLTLDKLLLMNQWLAEDDVETERKRFCVIGAAQVTDLLNIAEARSMDTNAVRTLYEGQIAHFMGFHFLHSQKLDKDENGHRKAFTFLEGAFGLGKPGNIEVNIAPDPGKSFRTRIYMEIGAVRKEDKYVLQVLCKEPVSTRPA
uniref:Uncharacterized protein n=1 Tax=Candidatus Kentrum sp. UNK TaxID=2126344 RepID=A0A451ARE4_9GAMM|nr:MAG: hypothetical protein BECKUNK1418G_GA0071005_100539 [Candidatus Kentron sp. UNK]VFK68619.1 MAG: hypothetical protein BECKUNK1418H_GA0071006_100439 [Candidatus Kentron sp. UNK]